jgi:hypothetical protein
MQDLSPTCTLVGENTERTDTPKRNQRKKISVKTRDWKAMTVGQEKFVWPLLRAAVRQVLEAETCHSGEALPGRRLSISKIAYN